MGRKKPTFNSAMAKIENKQNSKQDFTTEFAKENTFDQINLPNSESKNNKQFQSKKKDVEFGMDEAVKTNNKKSQSRNKKNNRHGNKNRQNNNWRLV